jgi:hypothetical protein
VSSQLAMAVGVISLGWIRSSLRLVTAGLQRHYTREQGLLHGCAWLGAACTGMGSPNGTNFPFSLTGNSGSKS